MIISKYIEKKINKYNYWRYKKYSKKNYNYIMILDKDYTEFNFKYI